MAIGDLPKIPTEYYPRLRQVASRIDQGELTPADLRSHILTVLGRVRMGAEGVSVQGVFGQSGLTADEMNGAVIAAMKLIDFVKRYRGRELIIKTGSHYQICRVGLNLKKRPATAVEVADPALPIFEWNGGGESAVVDWLRGLGVNAKPECSAPGQSRRPLTIHRLEALAEWLGEGWEEYARFLNVLIPALPLTQKGTLDRLGESVPAFLDAVLTRCGV
jgi:hypothetical protein